MRETFNRKFALVFILGVIFYFGLFNGIFIENKAHAATNVWAEKSKVKFGENIRIH